MMSFPPQELSGFPQRQIVGCIGWSGAGKTRLMTSLIRWFCQQGVGVCVLKHSHHRIGSETPQKDSALLRAAGAREVLAIGRQYEDETEGRMPLAELLHHINQLAHCPLVLVEGLKAAPWPKIEVHRPCLGQPPLWPAVSGIVAVASDAIPDYACPLPVLDLNRPETIGAFIRMHWMGDAGDVSST